MSKIGVSYKIDVSKIDKSRLFKGAKGTYLDITSFIDLDQLDQYGNSGMITQDVSKDEKAQGVKGPILGNCKVFWSENGQAPQAQGMQTNNLNQQPVQNNTPISNGGFGQAPQNLNQPPQQQQGAGGFGQQMASGQPAPRPQQQQQQQQQNNDDFGSDIPF